MLVSTHSVFDDRKTEIEFYYSVMVDIDDESRNVLQTIDNLRFFRIMKSNFLLMLYNLVEATFTTGMLEIYEQVKQDGCSYESLIDEIQNIWRDYRIREIYKPDSGLNVYTDRVKKIIEAITQDTPLIMTKGMLNISGNLNAKQIKKICDQHKIRYRVSDDQRKLDTVKSKRNSLAHGDESFSQCARDLTVSDLENIKDTVLLFISEILAGMDLYYDEKQYLRPTS